MQQETFSRQQLYELVWKTPLSVLARKYAFSDNGFRKLCKRMEIPLPKNGHWQKIQYGKPIKIEMLSENYSGEDTVILELRQEGSPAHTDDSPLAKLMREIKNDPRAPVTVPDILAKPEPITAATKSYWAIPERERYLRGKDMATLPIYVGKEHQKRALRFMDAFIKLLMHRGHSIAQRNHETYIWFDDVDFPFALREATKRVPTKDRWGTSDYEPTGRFILKTGKWLGEKEWKDGKQTLEDQLVKIVAYLEIKAQEAREEKARIAQRRAELEELERQKQALAQRRKDELNNFKLLLQTAERHDKALALRTYIRAVEQDASVKGAVTDELRAWLQWARDKADWFDPMVNKPDDLLPESRAL